MHVAVDRIERLEDERARALVSGDVAALGAITDDDYVHVEANGRLRDKAGFLAAIATSAVRLVSCELFENLIKVYGDTAVVTGRFENLIAGADNEPVIRRGRHCRIYVRRPDGWKNVLHQGTEIAP